MSSTTNDGKAEEATPLAYAEHAERLNLLTGAHAEAPKTPRQPVGIYGAAKYGECRFPTLQEQFAGAHEADTPGVERAEA
jgi:hypothetical protein